MPWQNKRPIQLNTELEETKASYPTNGVDLHILQKALRKNKCAQTWLRQHRDNRKHPQKSYCENLVGSTRDLAEKYKKLFTNITKTHHKTQAGLKHIYLWTFKLFENYYVEGLIDYMFTYLPLSFVVTCLSVWHTESLPSSAHVWSGLNWEFQGGVSAN